MTFSAIDTNIGWKDAVNPTKIRWVNSYVQGGKVLDLGAGKGWYSTHLAEKGYQVVSMDQHPLFDHPKVKILQRDLEQPLPFRDETFDTVLAWDVIEHIENEENILSEIYRVLKQEGILLLSVPHADDSRIASSYLTYCHFKNRTHKREYLPDELEKRLVQFGFQKIKIELSGGDGYPYVLLSFIDNKCFQFLTKVYIYLLKKTHILQVKNCHGDIFAVFKKARSNNSREITYASS